MLSDEGVEYIKQYYPIPDVTWEDVIEKLDEDVLDGDWGYSNTKYPDKILPVIVGTGRYVPESILPIWEAVVDDVGMDCMHTYIGFSKFSATLGRHNDDMDVFIVQAIGETSYKFDSGVCHTLKPGDAIFIPAYVYHHPFSHGPRVSLSFSNDGRS